MLGQTAHDIQLQKAELFADNLIMCNKPIGK